VVTHPSRPTQCTHYIGPSLIMRKQFSLWWGSRQSEQPSCKNGLCIENVKQIHTQQPGHIKGISACMDHMYASHHVTRKFHFDYIKDVRFVVRFVWTPNEIFLYSLNFIQMIGSEFDSSISETLLEKDKCKRDSINQGPGGKPKSTSESHLCVKIWSR
jgi:hypothetical protein